MGWPELIQDLEARVEGTLRGTYRPLDNVPFFRVQYPPEQEREALGQFSLFADRLRQRGWRAECISLTEISREALERLLNCPPAELAERLRNLERDRGHGELREQLSEHLPQELADALARRLESHPKESVAVLLRLGALYPFIRSSSLESRMEGRFSCAVVLPYPGTTVGALLDATPVDPHGGYYRGDILAWR